MDDPRWAAVDHYFADKLVRPDPALAATLEANARSGLPAIDVSPLQGKLLHILARAVEAKNILEIGTLGGYSTIWLARALAPGGKVMTLEADPAHAAIAMANLERAGLSAVVEVRVGVAAETLPRLKAEGHGPFDLVFIDADKENNALYLKWSLAMSRPGTVIIGDNIVRNGTVTDAVTADPTVVGSRQLINLMAAEPRLVGTAIQTVGVKGYDGFAIALVMAE